jgi:2-dehydro-3-deoxyphosphooctonate aldolase (KDO 8-P synthase)
LTERIPSSSRPPLVLASIAAGANGLFLETHPHPERAPSDGSNMLPLAALDDLIGRAVAHWEIAQR